MEQLIEVIEQCGVPSENIVVNLSLGRGVNYYTGLVFEIHTQDDEGFDAQLCGGGRYDTLIRAVGGSRDVNACGFAFGVERLLSLLPPDELPVANKIEALVIPLSAQEMAYALHVARAARAGGMATEVDVTGRGVGAGLRLAAKRQARLALIVGEDERRDGLVTVRDLEAREEHRLSIEQLSERIVMKE